MATAITLRLSELPSVWSLLTEDERRSCLEQAPICEAAIHPLKWMQKWTRTKDEQDAANPFKPFPQREYFEIVYRLWESEPVLLIEKSRTMLLTWLISGLCLHMAMVRPATKIIFWAQDEDRALKLLEYCGVLWEQQDPLLKQEWRLVKPWAEQAYNLKKLMNGSALWALPGKDPDKVRSEHPTVLVLDEAAFIERGGEAYDVGLSTRVPKLVAVTSANPGWFRNLTRPAVAVSL